MSSAIPERLSSALAGRYRIEREIGAGGMATVYLAHDIKHDRRVALKVLKAELAAVLGAERFVVEIKTTASLQHPHILPLFDSGTADGFLYYVMPFIDGETLRGKLDRETQLGIDEAVKITTDVADALEYAHSRGVIHRDIKPENILLANGRPMVADFGIALAVSAAAGGRMTETGLSLGTPHYMSPEQATADKEISARSDIYSLASVLYEMLTGSPPHVGSSAQQIIMRIVTDTARPVTELRKSVPPNVAAAVSKALEKLPADRFASARSFAEALANPSFRHGASIAGSTTAASATRVLGRAVSWRTVAVTVAIAFAVVSTALLALIVSRSGERSGTAMVTRAELQILSRTDSGVATSGVDVSPDGSMIVYAARLPGAEMTYNLYLRRIDEREARLIPGTSGAMRPAFSPDGQSIAFILDNKGIRRIPVTGVVVESIVNETAEGTSLLSLRWARDGFLYYDHDGVGLTRVPERGGTKQLILGDGDPAWVDPLPDGKHVLYTTCCGPSSDVRILEIATRATRSLGVQATEARYVPTGHLLLRTDEALKAVAFDLGTLKTAGEPVPVLDSVAANGSVTSFALSRAGTAVYTVRPRPPGPTAGERVVLVDRAGTETSLQWDPARYYDLRFSPDGGRVAFVVELPGSRGLGATLWVHDLVRGGNTKRSFGESTGVAGPVWNSAGDRLWFTAFIENSVGYAGSVRADGSGGIDTLWSAALKGPFIGQSPLSLSPDGTRMLVQTIRGRSGQAPNFDLGIATFDGKWSPVAPYLNADWIEQSGRISPDGKWVAYESDEERGPGTTPARRRVYVRSFPEPGQRYSVSDSIGAAARWAPDGRTIYYWRGSTLVAASVRTTPTFAVVSRADLFTRGNARGEAGAFDVHPDGNRFVMTVRNVPSGGPLLGDRAPTRLVLVVNWLEEFKRRVRAPE